MGQLQKASLNWYGASISVFEALDSVRMCVYMCEWVWVYIGVSLGVQYAVWAAWDTVWYECINWKCTSVGCQNV